MPLPPVDHESFKRALGHFASGVVVVTTRDRGGRDHGMTVSAFSSLSLDPPLVLACIGHDATLAGPIAEATHVGVSVLAERQEVLSQQFARQDADRFDGAEITRGESGVALLDGALAHLECRVVARHDAGDHAIVVGEVIAARTFEGRPLLYWRGAYARIGR